MFSREADELGFSCVGRPGAHAGTSSPAPSGKPPGGGRPRRRRRSSGRARSASRTSQGAAHARAPNVRRGGHRTATRESRSRGQASTEPDQPAASWSRGSASRALARRRSREVSPPIGRAEKPPDQWARWRTGGGRWQARGIPVGAVAASAPTQLAGEHAGEAAVDRRAPENDRSAAAHRVPRISCTAGGMGRFSKPAGTISRPAGRQKTVSTPRDRRERRSAVVHAVSELPAEGTNHNKRHAYLREHRQCSCPRYVGCAALWSAWLFPDRGSQRNSPLTPVSVPHGRDSSGGRGKLGRPTRHCCTRRRDATRSPRNPEVAPGTLALQRRHIP